MLRLSTQHLIHDRQRRPDTGGLPRTRRRSVHDIAPDIEIYTNGLSLGSEHDGPAMARESIESWRALAPDLRMELSQEIREKHRIAIEFRITEPTPGTPLSGQPAAGRSTLRAQRS